MSLGGPSESEQSMTALSDELLLLRSLQDGEWDPDALLEALNDEIGACGASEQPNKSPLSTANGPKSQRKGPKKRNYDPNKARSEQLRELQRLHVEVTNLQLKLQQIQVSPSNGSKSDPFPPPDRAEPKVWEDICTRQLARRLKAEQENWRLRKKLRAEKKVVTKIDKLLVKRLAMQNVEPEAAKWVRRVEIPSGFVQHLADRIFDELSTGVDRSCREVGKELESNCPFPLEIETRQPLLREGVSIELFDIRVLPFDVQATGDAWWRRWQNYKGIQHSHEDAEQVVRERCGLEMGDVKTHKSATFYVLQVLHRQVEDHRVVFIWHSYFEPFTFRGERVRGVTFLLKGSVLMKRLDKNSGESGSAATRVLTCYNVTPHFLDPKLRKDAKTSALIKFAVSAMSANISTANEMMENLLVDQALQKCN